MSQTAETLADGTLILKELVQLPEVLDVLIVGGGPGGTAAALRAKELDLSVLVIDFDDLMKRIRDYAKDKLILPNFGGGDKMKFPQGGALVSLLHFSPIDKDDMCVEWKCIYRDNNVPAQIGIELTGMSRADDLWDVKTWNHNLKQERTYLAKHVIIAIGRGVPRRFDIPGNTDGIAYRLTDPAAYIGSPACVIGGGTSAAEAVIGISNAKSEADDPTAVYWSYRGEKMPKVSKALAEAFFEANVGNGNIRLHLRSEPVAIVTAEDRKEYLSIRTDRKFIEQRPNETSHLEFPKERCIACIGEDIPEGFLNSLGIYMATGGPNKKKRMVVTPLLETQQPNVYLVGDILSQAYFETKDFNDDPATFEEVKHRGNIKSALRDGVFAIEVIKQKLAGQKEIRVSLRDAETAPPKDQPGERVVDTPKPVDSEAPPESSLEPGPAFEGNPACLIRVLPGNIEEEEFRIKAHGITTIGRKDADITFSDDTLMSSLHASISHTGDGYFLRDDGSANGVFLRAAEARHLPVSSGDLVKVGRQFLIFGASNGGGFITHYDHDGREVNRHNLSGKTIVLGRQAPDVTLDSQDLTLSRRHLAVSVREGNIYIKDLKSVNGTYLKVKSSVKLEHGDQFRVGQQVFIFSLKSEAVLDSGHDKSVPQFSPKSHHVPAGERIKPDEQKAAPRIDGLTVMFSNLGKSFAIRKEQTICEIAEENDIELSAECHAGVCGSDPIRILAGQENLNPLDEQEKETIEDLCGLSASECRMACMTKISGPVEVEIIAN